jgi:hypothetical protein
MTRRLSMMAGGVFLLGLMASPALAQEKPPVMAHDAEGKANCMMCHAAGVMEPVPDVPASHEGRVSETCLWCHAADSPMQTTGAKQMAHDTEGKDNCMMCHAAGVMEPVPDAPASHEGRANETCGWCHKAGG